MLLADIASGETSWADIFFLIAVILFVIGGVTHVTRQAWNAYAYALLCFGLAFVSLGLLVL